MKLNICVVSALCVLAVGQPVDEIESGRLLATTINQFSTKFLQQLEKSSDGQKNVFYSPISIHAAFSMMFSGARGQTEEQLRQVLGFGKERRQQQSSMYGYRHLLTTFGNSDGYELFLVNRVVSQVGLEVRDSFKQV